MLLVPTAAVPSQVFDIALGQQNVTLRIYQKSTGMFMDVLVNDTVIVAGVICLDRNLIVRDTYLGFIGDLGFYDTQGTDDPVSTGLGTRFLLIYLEAADLVVA